MSDITIPAAVEEAVARALHDVCAHESMSVCRGFARAALTAGLAAWPGMSKVGEVYGLQQEWWLELPLPTEASDDQ